MRLKEIHIKNKLNYELLGFKNILKNNERKVFDRIISKQIFTKYSDYFFQKEEYLEEYLSSNYEYIKKNILKQKLNSQNLEGLYKQLFLFFDVNKLGYRNKENINVKTGTEIHYSNSQDILKEINISLIKYYQNTNSDILEKILKLTIYDFLFKIHPFSDNNFLFSSILIDILLIENNLLPVDFKNTVKNNGINKMPFEKIEMKELYLDTILSKYKKYDF